MTAKSVITLPKDGKFALQAVPSFAVSEIALQCEDNKQGPLKQYNKNIKMQSSCSLALLHCDSRLQIHQLQVEYIDHNAIEMIKSKDRLIKKTTF